MTPKISSKNPNSIAGTTLLAVPFVLVGFTAAMIHVPADPRPPRAPQLLNDRGIERSATSAIDAATNNDVLILRLLTESGTDLNSCDENGITPLIAAARSNSAEAMRFLTRRHHVEFERTDNEGMTAMAHAIERGHIDRVEQLASIGASVSTPCRNGRPPLLVATQSRDFHMLHTLLGLGEREGLSNAVREAIGSGEIALADYLLIEQESLAPSVAASVKADLLAESVAGGHPDRVALLLAHRAATDLANENQTTPLGAAIESGNAEICELLLTAGVSPDAPCAGPHTPLCLAWSNRDHRVAKLLLQHDAAPHPEILSEAALADEMGFVRLLAEHGAPFCSPLESGDTLLTHAIAEGDLARVEDLLRFGASPDVHGKEGQSALAIATARSDAEAVELLLAAGADPNLQLAKSPTDEFLELANSKTLSYYMKRDSRFTPLMVAAAVGDGDTIRALLAGGASRSKYTRSWKRYPISFASSAGHILAQQLITGYDPEKREDEYKITIDLSSQRATLYKNGEAVNSSNVSTGKAGYRTPTGEYVVTHKHRHHNSTLYGSSMPYFMRLSCGAFGTHTGNCPGYPASHGCIRMPNYKAKQFFHATPAGTHVSIVK